MDEVSVRVRRADLQLNKIMHFLRPKCRMVSDFGPIPYQTITVVLYMILLLFLLTTEDKYIVGGL